MSRDTSRDGIGNQLQTYALTHFSRAWTLVQNVKPIARVANKALIDSAIGMIPARPFEYSLMTLDPCVPDTQIPKKTDSYSSWDSLNDRRYTGRHLPPDPQFNRDGNLPKLEDLAVLFRKRDGRTRLSPKSSLLFPYFVQWFTDGFLRTDRVNRLRNTSNHHIDLCTVYGLGPPQTRMLRAFQGGKLKSQPIGGEEYPPFYYADPEAGTVKPEFDGLYVPLNDELRLPAAKKALLFAMGVERANIQFGFVMFNTLCLREHNRLAALLATAYPGWDDERLFQTARNILLVEIMKVVIEEYINHISPTTSHPIISSSCAIRRRFKTKDGLDRIGWRSSFRSCIGGTARYPISSSTMDGRYRCRTRCGITKCSYDADSERCSKRPAPNPRRRSAFQYARFPGRRRRISQHRTR